MSKSLMSQQNRVAEADLTCQMRANRVVLIDQIGSDEQVGEVVESCRSTFDMQDVCNQCLLSSHSNTHMHALSQMQSWIESKQS